MMRALLIAAAVLTAVLPAHSAEARKYAVLSLIGDRLMIATRDMATGSRLDQNRRQSVELPDPVLDNTALEAVVAAIEAAEPQASVVLLGTRDPALYAAQARMLDKGGETAELLARITSVAAAAQASHLVLVAKLRHEAMLRVRDGHVGTGWLEGLGFYIDRIMPLVDDDTHETWTGFLAPFAYFRVVLVDLKSGNIVGDESVLASTTRGSQAANHPWDSMSAEQKVRALQSLIRDEMRRVVPKLLPAQ